MANSGNEASRPARGGAGSSAAGSSMAGSSAPGSGTAGADSSSVLLDRDGAVATVTLNRPDVLNALDTTMVAQLGDAFARVAAEVNAGIVRCVLVTGAGRGFCAGADLADPQVRTDSADLGAYLRRNYHPLIEGMRRLPCPIVAAVNGAAAGAGMSLALACDVVLAARSASFIQVFSRIGLIPDAGSTWFLPRLVGQSRALALALLAEKIDADLAERIGLVWRVHDDAALLPAARQLAERLASQPTRAFALIKETMNCSLEHPLAEQLEIEASAQSSAGRTEDFREGVAAFLEKRKPLFRGR